MQAPVDIHWMFRPNEFLIESLRDHSVLSIVWLLSVLYKRSRRSLIFVEPVCLGYTRSSAMPDAEVDLLAISDGETLLCEAKSSWAGLRAADISKFVELARRLRPDSALLAVIEPGIKLKAELEVAEQKLAEEQINFGLVTPDASD